MTGDPPKLLADGVEYEWGMPIYNRADEKLDTWGCVVRLGWNAMYERSGWQIALTESPHLTHPLDEFASKPSEWTTGLAKVRRELRGLALKTMAEDGRLDSDLGSILDDAILGLEKLVYERAKRSGKLPWHRRDGETAADFYQPGEKT